MDIMCTDNRFEIIGKAKEHLLEATNIDTSPKEMEVLDNFLFRCWQMGWLDRYAEQTEPQTMYYPQVDGITPSVIVKTEPQIEKCPFDDSLPCEWVCTEYGKCKYKPKTECSWK